MRKTSGTISGSRLDEMKKPSMQATEVEAIRSTPSGPVVEVNAWINPETGKCQDDGCFRDLDAPGWGPKPTCPHCGQPHMGLIKPPVPVVEPNHIELKLRPGSPSYIAKADALRWVLELAEKCKYADGGSHPDIGEGWWCIDYFLLTSKVQERLDAK